MLCLVPTQKREHPIISSHNNASLIGLVAPFGKGIDHGFDIAPSAIRLATEKTRAAELKADFRLGNFLQDEPPFQFDWLFEHTLFCAIQPDEREPYVQAVLRWLKPNGQYLAVNYFIPDTEGPPFGTTREEIVERFSPQKIQLL